MEDNTDPNLNIKNRRFGIKKGIYILPSLFTTASLLCGFYSVTHAVTGDFIMAAWAILFAGVFDALDGRIARLTKSQSEFGIEYDSLVDLASFGLAPAILVFTWSLHDFGRLGWGVSFLYFACGALRLARFNVQTSGAEKRFFQGLPIPVAAYALASYLIFHDRLAADIKIAGYVLLPLTGAIALLMVSTIHYRSFKQIDFSKPHSFLFLVFAAVAFFIVASAPQETLFVASMVYVLSGLVDEVLHLKNRKNFLEKKLAEREREEDQSRVFPFKSKGE